MIDNLFGLPSVASHTMERYTTSVLTATLTPPAEPVPEFRAIMQSLSEDSCSKYRQIVYEDPGPFFFCEIVCEDPDFLEYLRSGTPDFEFKALSLFFICYLLTQISSSTSARAHRTMSSRPSTWGHVPPKESRPLFSNVLFPLLSEVYTSTSSD